MYREKWGKGSPEQGVCRARGLQGARLLRPGLAGPICSRVPSTCTTHAAPGARRASGLLRTWRVPVPWLSVSSPSSLSGL